MCGRNRQCLLMVVARLFDPASCATVITINALFIIQPDVYESLQPGAPQHSMEDVKFIQRLTTNGSFEVWKATLPESKTCIVKKLKGKDSVVIHFP